MHYVYDYDAPRGRQLVLFPPPHRPSWQTLPLETQQIVTRLLATLLHQHSLEHDSGKEVDDD
jgi:hypothetical protein